MDEYNIRFIGGDGCTYCYDEKRDRWIKFCVVNKLPHDIKEQLAQAKENAKILLKMRK